MTDILRCKHGHSRLTHPYCFQKQGREIVVKSKINQIPESRWYENLRIGFLDIETTGFNANDGYMLSWALKEKDGATSYDFVTQNEIFGIRNIDKRIVKSLVAEMRQYDVLVTYFGVGFDIKYIRSRSLYHEIDFPKWKEILHIDLYFKVKHLLKLSRNSLKVATQFFGIQGKTSLDLEYWRLAALGDKKSMKELLVHNKGDVDILQDLFYELEQYTTFNKNSI